MTDLIVNGANVIKKIVFMSSDTRKMTDLIVNGANVIEEIVFMSSDTRT
jgi:hypothetical protein